jgi:3-dehydroquinate synthase
MQRTEITVDLGERGYPIVVATGELDRLGEFARERSQGWQALVVCDDHTGPLFADVAVRSLETAGFRRVVCQSIPSGEESKNRASADLLYGALHDLRAERTSLVVALGGGVIGDLAGFVAATYARGVSLLQVPTTLLAQVDSAVGGKVGINFEKPGQGVVKNMIGAFHQPVGVFADTDTLRQLPPRELRAGLAEVVKYGMIMDAGFFSFLDANAASIMALDPAQTRQVVARSCALKARVVEEDEFERKGRRSILNLGHTFAHGIEAVTRAYRHGEAVAIGMNAACLLARRLGTVAADVGPRLVALLGKFGLPTTAPGLVPDAMLEAMRHDKKAKAGMLRFILPAHIGSVEMVQNVEESMVRAVLEEVTSTR